MDSMARIGLAVFAALAPAERGLSEQASIPRAALAPAFRLEPQWLTGPRLLRSGEKIEFEFYLPPGMAAGSLDVFPQYLERAEPGRGFRAGGELAWVDGLPRESLRLAFVAGRAAVSYVPKKSGSYLARWQVGRDTFYRYFATIKDDWCVLRFSAFEGLESEPTLHATGIPLDYRLPVERFRPEDRLLKKFLGYHRHYGDAIIPAFPDTPRLSLEERVKVYGEGLNRVRQLVPDPSCARSARVEMRHELDPGYTETFMRLGVNDHCGLNEANAKPWLGMPEFPYFSSPIDCRKAHQGEGGSVIAHQWDFCGGWHFLGPVSWHYKAAAGDWTRAEPCLRQGIEELVNLADLSGHPAFAVPLYDGLVGPGYPNPAFTYAVPDMLAFVEKYQRLIAFDFPKRHRVVFARSIDMADYYRRHFRVTPRTIFVSRTTHVDYDKWWLCHWCADGILVPRERIPWETRVSSVHRLREIAQSSKDPLSYEYVLVEDQRRQMRFERECPNPVWWFDYATAQRGPGGSAISWVKTPDVEILRSAWTRTGDTRSIRLRMRTQASFPNYAICLWGLPVPLTADRSRIATNAKDFIAVKNTSGESHLVLVFDLKPDAELTVSVR